jgi:hypothetical protein
LAQLASQAPADELGQLRRDRRLPAGQFFHFDILGPRAFLLLNRFHRLREGDIAANFDYRLPGKRPRKSKQIELDVLLADSAHASIVVALIA